MGALSYLCSLCDKLHRLNGIWNDYSSPAILCRNLPSKTHRSKRSRNLIFRGAIHFLSYRGKETSSSIIYPDPQCKLRPLQTRVIRTRRYPCHSSTSIEELCILTLNAIRGSCVTWPNDFPVLTSNFA